MQTNNSFHKKDRSERTEEDFQEYLSLLKKRGVELNWYNIHWKRIAFMPLSQEKLIYIFLWASIFNYRKPKGIIDSKENRELIKNCTNIFIDFIDKKNDDSKVVEGYGNILKGDY